MHQALANQEDRNSAMESEDYYDEYREADMVENASQPTPSNSNSDINMKQSLHDEFNPD